MEEGTENTIQEGTTENEGNIVQEENEQEVVQESDQEQQTQETTAATNDYMYIQSEQLELTNHLISGQIFFLGLIFGVILFKIFWDRWKV